MRRGALAPRGLGSGARGAGQSCMPRTCPMAASEVAQKERDVPTFRRIAGAGLEVAGALGLELEEDEEEAAARRARSFAQDARVRFLGGRLEQVLGLPAEKWSRHLESEDNRQVLGAFLESPSPACLVCSVAAAGWLAASRKVRGDGRRATGEGTRPGRGRPAAPPRALDRTFVEVAPESAEFPPSAPALQCSERLHAVFWKVSPGASSPGIMPDEQN